MDQKYIISTSSLRNNVAQNPGILKSPDSMQQMRHSLSDLSFQENSSDIDMQLLSRYLDT
eukprot:scaffold4266_cov139-Skeletonema_menzelii.AAC.4